MTSGTIPSWFSTMENPKRQGDEKIEVCKMISMIMNGMVTHEEDIPVEKLSPRVNTY
jgi:hypothetical protein